MSKLVFITGASSGIGQAMAERFYAAGYSLALVARRGEVIEQWTKAKGLEANRYKVYSADVSNVDSIIAAANACVIEQGLPDVVIANAGISIGIDTAERADLDMMREVYATNNIGLAATFSAFIRPMQERSSGKLVAGKLVGIASVAGIRGLPGHGAYSSSKAAVISYCESLRGEMKEFGVQVLTILPGYIDTPLTRKNKYSMPFMMQPEAFADKAYKAIEDSVSYRVIPWQMGLMAKLLRLLPNWLFDKALAGRPRKHRGSD
jgi:short-subunit dehydrogenase